MIEDYEFGRMIIDGKNYDNDLIIYDDKIVNWWRKEGHVVNIDDLKDLPDEFNVIVIGSGSSGVCVIPDKTIEYIKNKSMEIVIEITGNAVKTYNRLVDEGKKVVGVFHLRC